VTLVPVALVVWLQAADSTHAVWPSVPEPPVTMQVFLDSVPVYVATGEDSARAAEAAALARRALETLRRSHPETVRLEERHGAGVLIVDSLVVLEVGTANRVDTSATPLANALRLRERIVSAPRGETRLVEEELLLRLLLGIVYPVTLLVLLRMTRLGLRRWERRWRRSALRLLERIAIRRGLPDVPVQGRRLVDFLTGVERIVLFGLAVLAVSFTWFALFPQTRPLASELLDLVIAPLLRILGGLGRAVLLLTYSVIVVAIAGWLARRVAWRSRTSFGATVLGDPLVHVPLRIGIWLVALFLLLLPYPGAPRQFAVGVLLLLLLAALIALRPILEEIATGIYLNRQYELRLGSRFTLDGAPCEVVGAGLVHVRVARDGVIHRIPYSRVLRSDFATGPDTKENR
jgi:hypothetical protein